MSFQLRRGFGVLSEPIANATQIGSAFRHRCEQARFRREGFGKLHRATSATVCGVLEVGQ